MNWLIIVLFFLIGIVLGQYQSKNIYQIKNYDPANYKMDLLQMRAYAFPSGAGLFPWNYSTIGPDTNRREFEIGETL